MARVLKKMRDGGKAAIHREPSLRRGFAISLVLASMASLSDARLAAAAEADKPAVATREPGDEPRKAAVVSFLRHIYSVYFGIRACAEMSVSENDASFKPEVTLEEARRTLRSIDAATAEIGVDSSAVWNSAAPIASVTAEALKVDPTKNLPYCHKMGRLFRVDAGNLQESLRSLGARTPLIPKDY